MEYLKTGLMAEPTGRALEGLSGAPESPVRRGKDPTMWVFDGEEWTEEGGSQEKKTSETILRINEFVPELQIVEIVPVPRKNPVVPFPMP